MVIICSYTRQCISIIIVPYTQYSSMCVFICMCALSLYVKILDPVTSLFTVDSHYYIKGQIYRFPVYVPQIYRLDCVASIHS